MKKYESSHPWLTFRLDTRKFDPLLWMALGEAQSKCDHIAGVPLKPQVSAGLHIIFLAKGALATTAIEGNTLSLEEAEKAVAGELHLPPSKEYLRIEIENIVKACNVIGQAVLQEPGSLRLSPEMILKYNRMVLEGLETDEEVVPGLIRNYSVTVGRYLGAPHEDCRFLLDRLCRWLNEDFVAPSGLEIAYGLLRAIIAHIYLAWIHPFGDGNGRTARLVEFQILLSAGVPTPAAHVLSNFYNETRQEYYRQLERASQSGGDVIPFIAYAIRGFVDQLKDQLRIIRDQVWSVTWENYVHEQFKDKEKKSGIRQKHLVLDLSRYTEPVPVARLASISPRVAADYAKVSPSILIRDVNILTEKMGLLERSDLGVRAKREQILSFLPDRASTPDKP